MRLRYASLEDIEAIRSLIEQSVLSLQAEDYSAEQMEGALGTVFGVDTQLILDGTYFVIEAGSGELAACGGWSKRKTLFGSDQADVREDDLLDPTKDAAKVRAFFVHPNYARQGLGTQLLDACENAALAAGFKHFEMGATLTGVKLYEKRGYVARERIEVPLANGASLPVVKMEKNAPLIEGR